VADNDKDEPERRLGEAEEVRSGPAQEEAVHPVRPLDPSPWPGDGGVPPTPPLPHGPRPIDHLREDDPLGKVISPTQFVVEWDPQIPLSAEGRSRLDRQIRRAVMAELGESDFDADISISTVAEQGKLGIRIQRL
jgi:hypothetical protein